MPYITGQGEEGSTDLTLGVSWPKHSPGIAAPAAMVQWAATQSPPESAESPLESRARLAGSRAGRTPTNTQHRAASSAAASALSHRRDLLTCTAPACVDSVLLTPPQLSPARGPSPLHG